MDATTGEPVKGASANPVGFEAETTSGTAQVGFQLDASELAGRTLVAFETLLDEEGNVVARHEDLSDEAQSVVVASAREAKTQQGSTSGSVPHTGDQTNLAATVALALLAAGTLAVATLARRRAAHQSKAREQGAKLRR